MKPAVTTERLVFRESGLAKGPRALPEETPVALTFNGGTYAVMMATPEDLEDFAIGFSLNEGIVETASEIRSFESIEVERGIELRMWLDDVHANELSERRRRIAGPTGCGLCGIDSITEAVLPAAAVGEGCYVSSQEIMAAMRALPSFQKLNIETRAVHAAAYWTHDGGIVAIREDVGRHNALDKLAGALTRQSLQRDGVVLLTSRVSVEMVQKTAMMGVSVLIAVSTPTALAVRMAHDAGITLAAVARSDGFEVFTHPKRIFPESTIVNVA